MLDLVGLVDQQGLSLPHPGTCTIHVNVLDHGSKYVTRFLHIVGFIM